MRPNATEQQRARQRVKARAWRAIPSNAAKNRANARKWEIDHPERAKTRARRYRENNRPHVAAKKAAWAKANPNRVAAAALRRRLKRYGLTLPEYERRLAEQNNRCKMCRDPLSGTPHIDHCHKTGTVRGLLCAGCNVALGAYELYGERARKYLISAVETV